MNRRLLLLNAVLAVVVVYAGVQFRNEWKAARAREAATMNRKVKAPPPPPYTPLPPSPPVLAAGYKGIADKMLFDKSRDSTVVIEVPVAPPPKPMPPLPVYYGMMNIGDQGPIVVLAPNKESPQRSIRPGETIGQFKLVDVNSEEVTLEWEGQTIRKKVGELTARSAAPAPGTGAPEAAARTETPAAAAAPAPPPVTGPGADTGRGFKVCLMTDGQAEGAVVDGYKKVVYPTPFGTACRYEPAGR